MHLQSILWLCLLSKQRSIPVNLCIICSQKAVDCFGLGDQVHCKDFTRHCGGFIPVGQLTPVTWYPGLQARSNNRYFKEKNILQVKPVEMAVITCKLFYPASAKSLCSLQGNITPMAVKTCNILDQKPLKNWLFHLVRYILINPNDQDEVGDR